MNDPFYEGPARFERERRVTEVPRPGIPTAIDVLSADEVFNDLAALANKARVLADASAEQAMKLSIPVHENSRQVRAAVRRKDQMVPDGSRITFDLFKDAIETVERRREALNLDALQDLTGTSLADHDQIRSTMSAVENDDVDPNLLPILLSEMMVLFVLGQVIKPYTNQDIATATAAKLIPGTEEPSVIAQTIIGIIYQLLIMGIEEATVKLFLERAAPGRDVDLLIDQAKSQNPTEMQDLAQRHAGQADYDLILQYCFEYIAGTSEPGYEMWSAYHEARRIRHSAMMAWRNGPRYSPRQALRAQGMVEREIPEITADGNSPEVVQRPSTDERLAEVVLDAIVPADVIYMCNLRDHTSRLNKSLNTIGQVVGSDFGQDVLCCLGRFLSTQDLQWLKQARQILHIFMGVQGANRRLDFGRLVAGFIRFIDERIQEELVHWVNKIVFKVAEPLLDSLTKIEQDEWDGLRACPLVTSLLEVVLNSINQIGDTLRNLVSGITVGWEDQFGLSTQERWYVYNTRRKVQLMLETLDQVLGALESGFLCVGVEGRVPEAEIMQFIDTLPTMPTVTISAEDLQAYFSDTEPIEVPDGIVGATRDIIPPLTDPKIRTGPGAESETETQRHCRALFEAILGEMTEGA